MAVVVFFVTVLLTCLYNVKTEKLNILGLCVRERKGEMRENERKAKEMR